MEADLHHIDRESQIRHTKKVTTALVEEVVEEVTSHKVIVGALVAVITPRAMVVEGIATTTTNKTISNEIIMDIKGPHKRNHRPLCRSHKHLARPRRQDKYPLVPAKHKP